MEDKKENYKLWLESLGLSIWHIQRNMVTDAHCKSYDPLSIGEFEEGYWQVASYVFDFHDGGRHHTFKTLEDIELGLKEELRLILQKWKIKQIN